MKRRFKTMYIAVLIMIVIDVCTGLLKGLYNKNIDSTILRRGFYHKISECFSMVVGYCVDLTIKEYAVDFPFTFLEPLCLYLIITEIVSIIENLCAVNGTLAKFFGPYLGKLKDMEEGKNKNEK